MNEQFPIHGPSRGHVRQALVFLLLFGFAAAAFPTDLSAQSTREITRLLTALGSSGCQFYRNGTWYAAPDAQAHLTKKYDYLLDKGLLASAEDFISKAGTKSSMSGELYQVKCGQAQAVPSATWLQAELHRVRSGNAVP